MPFVVVAEDESGDFVEIYRTSERMHGQPLKQELIAKSVYTALSSIGFNTMVISPKEAEQVRRNPEGCCFALRGRR